MRKKILSIIIGIIFVIIAGLVVFWQTNRTKNIGQYNSQNVPHEQNTQTPEPSSSLYPLADIAAHNSRSSCWSAINGGVYDLTSWIPNHPGGEQNILMVCGIDGSKIFNAQHGKSKKVLQLLSGFKIGELKQ